MQFYQGLVLAILFAALCFDITLFRAAGAPISADSGSTMHVSDHDPPGYLCSDGWRITGYFTPIETDYASTETSSVNIKNVGEMSFNADFLRVVFDESKGFGEGWGRTRFGWYLGNYDKTWHKSDAPLDANDTVLSPNSVAVDNALIPNQSEVRIPGLPGANGTKLYLANDVGVTVHGKHIDIYTGEGKEAERAMYAVTFEDDHELQRVCFRTP
jgi:3D (Asp-Asp-Asp) domain-containing protein